MKRVMVGWVIAALAISGACSSDGDTKDQDSGVLLEVGITPGVLVGESPLVVQLLSGDLEPSIDLAVAASCHNVVDWAKDDTLDNELVLGGNGRLVRVAEVLATHEAKRELVRLVEAQYWTGTGITLSADLRAAGFSQPELDDYLALLAQNPSPDAMTRYVVYAVSTTTTEGRIVYLDTQVMPAPIVVERSASQTVRFAAADGLLRTEVSRSQCEALHHG